MRRKREGIKVPSRPRKQMSKTECLRTENYCCDIVERRVFINPSLCATVHVLSYCASTDIVLEVVTEEKGAAKTFFLT
jgi:hypothetical protein